MGLVQAYEALPIKAITVMIYGQEGVGKTSLAYSASRPVMIDFDKGAHRSGFRNGPTEDMQEGWAGVVNLTKPDNLKNYDTVIIDTVQAGLDYLFEDICANSQTKMRTRHGNPTMDGWQAMSGAWQSFSAALRAAGKDLILLAHHKEEKDKDPVRVRPDIKGGSYNNVLRNTDFLGYMYTGTDAKGKPERVLDFNPSELWIGKNSAQFNPIKVPSLVDRPTFMADLITQMKQGIGGVSEANKKLQEDLLTWTDTIGGFSTPDEFAKAYPQFGELEPPLKQQVGQLVRKRREELGIEWTADKGFFVAPKAKAVAKGVADAIQS